MKVKLILTISILFFLATNGFAKTDKLLPIPEKLIVLTFDDGNVSDYTFTAPLLKKYGFGATFFIPSGWVGGDGRLNWQQMQELDQGGFEIGSHSKTHPRMVGMSREDTFNEIDGVDKACFANGVTKPVSFAWPGGHVSDDHFSVFEQKGYKFIRRGADPESPLADIGKRGSVYEPGRDHTYMIPSTVVIGQGADISDLKWALDQAKDGNISVLTLHGMPDVYPHCSVPKEEFKEYVDYLHEQGCTVIALRDLAKYIDPADNPIDVFGAIYARLGVRPIELKCENEFEPIGVETAKPRLSWILKSPRRGQTQSAYQVLVASSKELIDQDRGDMWDSGKVASDRSVNVIYDGKTLLSGRKYFWKVRTWNKPGVPHKHENETFYDSEVLAALKSELFSDYCDPASFTLGLKKSDWKAKWIAGDPDVSSPLLRKEFNVTSPVKCAVAFISGLGYYEMFVNGKKVGDHLLDPGTTYYDDDASFGADPTVLYVGYDITTQLKKGRNALGVMLGNGWYSAEDDIPESPSHRNAYNDRPVLLMQLHIELQDGTTMQIVSDGSFKTAPGLILYNDYNHGETYDARKELPGWAAAGFDDSKWTAAKLIKGPGGKRTAQLMPPIKVNKTFKPVRILNPKKDVYVFDFGQAFTGWSKLKVKGPKGTKVTLKHGMRVYEDSSLDNRSNWSDAGAYAHIARQIDTYILKGSGLEIWEPRFTLHGFRYVEVTGFPGQPTLDSLEGRFVHTSADTSNEFTCSNKLINQIHSNVRYTLLSSMQSYPQDAADRSERVGWMGDVNLAQDYNVNFNMQGFWRKWLNDLKDSQKPDGELPYVCPAHWRIVYDPYGWGIPVWKGVYPVICWFTYQYYDDRQVMVEHYESMKKWVDFFSSMASDYIVHTGLGDHMEPHPDGYSNAAPQNTPAALTSTAWYYFNTWIVAQAAQFSGKTDQYEKYSKLARKIKEAFNNEFLDKETNQYAGGSQTSNSVALSRISQINRCKKIRF